MSTDTRTKLPTHNTHTGWLVFVSRCVLSFVPFVVGLRAGRWLLLLGWRLVGAWLALGWFVLVLYAGEAQTSTLKVESGGKHTSGGHFHVLRRRGEEKKEEV